MTAHNRCEPAAKDYAEHVPNHPIDDAGRRMEGWALFVLMRNGRQDLPDMSAEFKVEVRATVGRGVAANEKLGFDEKQHAKDLVTLKEMLGNGEAPPPKPKKSGAKESAEARLEREGLWGPIIDIKTHLAGRKYAIDAFVAAVILAAKWTDADIDNELEWTDSDLEDEDDGE